MSAKRPERVRRGSRSGRSRGGCPTRRSLGFVTLRWFDQKSTMTSKQLALAPHGARERRDAEVEHQVPPEVERARRLRDAPGEPRERRAIMASHLRSSIDPGLSCRSSQRLAPSAWPRRASPASVPTSRAAAGGDEDRSARTSPRPPLRPRRRRPTGSGAIATAPPAAPRSTFRRETSGTAADRSIVVAMAPSSRLLSARLGRGLDRGIADDAGSARRERFTAGRSGRGPFVPRT